MTTVLALHTDDSAHVKQGGEIACLLCIEVSCDAQHSQSFIIPGTTGSTRLCSCAINEKKILHILIVYVEQTPLFLHTLTCFRDIKGQPEQKRVADQLSKQQTQREFHHTLHTHTRTHAGFNIVHRIQYTHIYNIHTRTHTNKQTHMSRLTEAQE